MAKQLIRCKQDGSMLHFLCLLITGESLYQCTAQLTRASDENVHEILPYFKPKEHGFHPCELVYTDNGKLFNGTGAYIVNGQTQYITCRDGIVVRG